MPDIVVSKPTTMARAVTRRRLAGRGNGGQGDIAPFDLL